MTDETKEILVSLVHDGLGPQHDALFFCGMIGSACTAILSQLSPPSTEVNELALSVDMERCAAILSVDGGNWDA